MTPDTVPTDAGSRHTWEEAEQGCRRALAEPLADYLALTRDCESVGYDLMQASARLVGSQRPGQMLQHAHATLVARVLRDVRAIDHLASLGFTMQAYTIASSCMEATYLAGYIGSDETRATEWLDPQPKDVRPDLRALVEGTAIFLERTKNPATRREIVDDEYDNMYRKLCEVKHVHGLPERARGWRRTSSGRVFRLPPFVDAIIVREACHAVSTAGYLAATILWVYWKAQVGTAEFEANIHVLVERANDLLDRAAHKEHLAASDPPTQ